MPLIQYLIRISMKYLLMFEKNVQTKVGKYTYIFAIFILHLEYSVYILYLIYIYLHLL